MPTADASGTPPPEPDDRRVCRLKRVEPQRVMSIRTVTTPEAIGPTIRSLLEQVWAYLNQQDHVTVGPAFVRYHELGRTQVELEAGFPVAEDLPERTPILRRDLPACTAATVLHEGPYDGLPEAYAALEAWIARQRLEPVEPPWEIYWVDGQQARGPQELRTEIVWPVRPTGGADAPG